MTPGAWYRNPYGDPGLRRRRAGVERTQATRPLGEDHEAPWEAPPPSPRPGTAVIVIIDRGNGQVPGRFHAPIPDGHKRQGDLDLLLTSLKVS